jgi:uncharacterized cupin superfamily protein
MEVEVKKISQDELAKKGIFSWPIWEKESSSFNWHYDQIEECYFLDGKVVLTTKEGKKSEFGKGDFVTFPKGLSCTWQVKEAVRKHYRFS